MRTLILCTSISVGLQAAEWFDLYLPLKFGIPQKTGDTVGPGGLFRGLRSAPVCAAIAQDMKPHLDKGEDIFLVWIDPKRTKRNIAHWAPIGPLSSYYMCKRLAELAEKGIEVTDESPLITNQNRRQLRPVSKSGVILQIHRIMMLASVVGRRQEHMTRYEKHGHSFRKFGVVEMQRAGQTSRSSGS